MLCSFHIKLCSFLVVLVALIVPFIIYYTPSAMTGNPFGETDDEGVSITSKYPTGEDEAFDYRRCAALHNMLVEQAWVAEGRTLEELETRSFFQRYGDEAKEILDRIDPSLKAFLDSINVSEQLPPFFFWVEGITPPGEMFSVHDMFQDYEERNRFLTLYMTNVGLGEHPLGLIYDQKLHRATLTLGLEDMDFVLPVGQHDDLWYPLETILGNWIHMVEIKKITASQDEAPNEKFGPWTWQPYSEAQVDSAVAAFERLAAIIEQRMPGEHQRDPKEYPLVSNEELDAASVPSTCFILSFLTRARRPAFRKIAPGLEIPHDHKAFVSNQKFTVINVDPDYGTVIPPVLIFASTERQIVDLDSPNRYVSFNPFAKAFRDGVVQGDRSIIAGLYSESVERSSIDVAEEGFRLLLPFRFHAFGQNGGARKSDGSLLTEGSMAELFQHGFKPFGGEWWRAQRLETLFNHWSYLIETGVWTIGDDGVQGGIDVFRDAHLSKDYHIRPSW
ncbi:hypothetical protein F5Y07DRAFT_372627 [Xylaria sp. FL0933]|nr:hypothetical protein F5Y07DRAFT_372627 [Xylaria sp. FL0933]